jgi:photosystem II stability/assembly factor-like uncharacterized protein
MKHFWALISASFLIPVAVVAALGALGRAASPEQLSDQLLASKLDWRSVGPYIGGRVVAVTGVPGEADLFYMGTVGGGVWKSTDYGLDWANISDGKLPGPSASIGAIAVAPSNHRVLYAGTGECDIRNTAIPGDGLFKSIDAGNKWEYAGLRDTHSICNIVVDPHNADTVYVASLGHLFAANPERGIFKTTDGGKSWQKVLFVDDDTGAADLVMDPTSPNVLYAAMWQVVRKPWGLIDGGPGSGLYKTTDGGAHWTNLSHAVGFPEGVLGRIGVAVAPSQPSVVYAIVQAKEGGVFRSGDAGETWKHVNDEWKLRQRAFYYMAIFVDPKDANMVYAPEVDGLLASKDGGKTWKALKTPHGDNHAVWIDPDNPKIMLEGNDGGATVTTDGGKTWSNEHNQPTAQFYHINIDDQFPYHIYGAQQDEGSFEGPSASPGGSIPFGDWKRVAYGESTYTVPQPGSPNITYGSGYFSLLFRYNMDTGQYREVSPWPEYQSGASSAELKYRFGWTHPILFSPNNPKEMLVGAQEVLKSDDYGLTWQQISPDLTRDVPSTEQPSGGPIDLDQSSAEVYPGISALAISPLDDNVIWAGSDDGLVHLTTDGGRNWQAVRPAGLPEWSWVNSIQPSYSYKATAYLAARRYMWDDFHPYVFKTTDFGQHWTSMTTGLPEDQYVFDLRQDPHDPDLLFLGGESTVYVSFDSGAKWQPLTLNLPVVQVRDVAIDTRQGQVAIATHGRSFWVLDNLTVLEQLTKHPQANSDDTYLFAPQQAWLTHAYGAPEMPMVAPSSGQNPPFGATVFFHIPSSYDGKTPVRLEFADEHGQTVRSFALHLKKKQTKEEEQAPRPENPDVARIEEEEKLTAIEPGMNRFQWDLRYADATEVKGFWPPLPAGGLPDLPQGPLVVPGSYTVTLDYGGETVRQTFSVALDPRLKATLEDLAAQLALEQKIHATLDRLDKAVNQAIDVRDRLEAAVKANHLTQTQAEKAMDRLDRAIGDVVEMHIRSSEGDLLHETKLHSSLAYLAADVGQSYGRPTAAMEAVFDSLDQRAKAGEQRLETAIADGNALL